MPNGDCEASIKMKKILVLLALLFTTVSIFAQDIITKKNGEEIQAKVLTINSQEINYLKWNNQNGPTYTIAINEVFMIKYANGEKDVFNDKAKETPQQQSVIMVPQQGNYSQSMYKFDEKQNVLDKAKRATSTAKTFDWIALPLGVVVGLGGMFALDEPNMVWVGLGVEVGALVISTCLHAKASRLERKASLYYGWHSKNINIGNSKLQASMGLMDNGRIGFTLDF